MEETEIEGSRTCRNGSLRRSSGRLSEAFQHPWKIPLRSAEFLVALLFQSQE
jgi:hypothetical protein